MATSRFDGLEVDQYLARFSGTFELEPHEVEYLSADNTIVAVVVARVNGAQFRVDKKSGEVKRVNTLDVQGFAVVDDPQLRETLFQHLAALAEAKPVIEMGTTAVNTATGEVTRDGRLTAVVTEDVIVVEPSPEIDPDEEVFTPGQDIRVAVGGAAKNDPVLKRFLEGG